MTHFCDPLLQGEVRECPICRGAGKRVLRPRQPEQDSDRAWRNDGAHRKTVRRGISRQFHHATPYGRLMVTLRHRDQGRAARSEEHTSELQSPMRISYAVFCLKKKNTYNYTYIMLLTLYSFNNILTLIYKFS